jgi:hypothetical protein
MGRKVTRMRKPEETIYLGDFNVDGRMILKLTLKNLLEWRGLD